MTTRRRRLTASRRALSRPGRNCRPDTDGLFYEGPSWRGCNREVDIAAHVDLRIGVVPVINLEWIQKLHRDKADRGYSTEAVTDTILRRMHDYVHYICPQFSRTHINFQRVPVVDTSNPFIARHIPAPDESMLVIRFADPRGIDFSLSTVDAAQFFHVASEHHRVPRRQDGPRDAAHLHADDLAADGTQKKGVRRVTERGLNQRRDAKTRRQQHSGPTRVAGGPPLRDKGAAGARRSGRRVDNAFYVGTRRSLVGARWPRLAESESSRFVEAADLRWHVQQMGAGPVLLLLHGTGASTHSWRALAPDYGAKLHSR